MLIVAGGTGGHILPAVAFGDWVRRERPDVTVHYMSGSRPVELEIYRVSEIEPFVMKLSGSPFGISGAGRVKRLVELVASCAQVWTYMKCLAPDLCVLFGGYASMPALIVAKMKKIRLVLHEQNARAGRVTKLAEKLSVPVASGWETCLPLRRGSFHRVGVPIRKFLKIAKDDAWRVLGQSEWRGGGPVVCVLTGSLGSGTVLETLNSLASSEGFSSWKFLVINPDVASPRDILPNLTHLPRMWNIAPLYAVSDMAVTRGGASTLSEVEALDIPAVLMPWKNAADDHQTENAAVFAKSDKIRIWDEESDSLEDLADKLNNLRSIYYSKTNDVSKRLYNADGAAEKICREFWDFAVGLRKGEISFGG
jgi:UDP-N-acetylglucosamine--N-acetylmuramyl-(pentapeptide) pyrophosphoryl-undecaprenol N-acetylglucosamine transferase